VEARVSAALAGIGYRRPHRDELLARPRPITLEIVPDHFFADPDAIVPLAERYPIVFHDVALSVATAGDPAIARARLHRIAELARLAHPILMTDHLAITRSPSGIDLGHLAPVWLVPEVLDLVCDRVRAIEDIVGAPVALENISAPFELAHRAMSEPEFFARLVDRTGCGLLLDVTNVLVDARNAGADAGARVRAYPLAAVRQIHLAGGRLDRDRRWIDSHDHPVEDESFALLAEVARARPGVRAIVVERDDRLGSLDELVAEAERAVRVWEQAKEPT
jgi:uncharacterized protein (UPF0276 family)